MDAKQLLVEALRLSDEERAALAGELIQSLDRDIDEGAEAHLWQLLMAGQLPIVAFFAATSLPQRPGPAIFVLTLQAVAALAALAPIFLLRW